MLLQLVGSGYGRMDCSRQTGFGRSKSADLLVSATRKRAIISLRVKAWMKSCFSSLSNWGDTVTGYRYASGRDTGPAESKESPSGFKGEGRFTYHWYL